LQKEEKKKHDIGWILDMLIGPGRSKVEATD